MLGHYKATLLKLFSTLRDMESYSDNIEMAKELQMDLIRIIKRIEQKIYANKTRIQILKKKKAIDRLEKIDIGKQINGAHEKIIKYKEIIYILKEIGDGVAFTYLDKWDIKPLVFKQASGFISGKLGFRREISIFRSLYRKSILAIFNDITNCLRYGDITAIRYGTPTFLEVKSSKKSSARLERQMQGLTKVANYLHKDKVEDLYSSTAGTMYRKSMHDKDYYYREKLNALIQSSYQSGDGYLKIEEGLYYCVLQNSEEPIVKLMNSGLIEVPYFYFINEQKFICQGYYPFTLSIRKPLHLYDFFAGNYVIIVIIDLKVLQGRIEQEGFLVEFMEGEYPIKITKPGVSHQVFQCNVSQHFLGRLGLEFLSLEWFIKEAINSAKEMLSGEYLLEERSPDES